MKATKLSSRALWEKWAALIEMDRSIYTWTSDRELAWLAEMASQAKSICEIGTYHGRSALVMRKANPNAFIDCFDTFVDDGCEAICRHNMRNVEKGMTLLLNASSDRLQKWPRKFDFAFIDGGHLFEDVKRDIANLLPIMIPGSVISGHDWRTDMTDGVNRGVLAHFDRSQINTMESIWYIQLP